MMTLGNTREQVPKRLQVSIRHQNAHFLVVFQHQYPHAVEETVYTQRFATTEDAQKFIDDGLRARRIYRNLADQ